jgi:hypothetical protein
MIRGILIGTAICVLYAANSNGSSINVTLKCHNGATCDARGTVRLQSIANKSLVRRVDLHASGLVIAEQTGTEWDLSLEANGFWGLPQRVVFPATDRQQPYTMDVWRTINNRSPGRLRIRCPQPGHRGNHLGGSPWAYLGEFRGIDKPGHDRS